jgi:hypothetical protein
MRQVILMIVLAAGVLSGAAWAQDIDPLSASSMPTSEDYWTELVADRIERQAKLDELMGTMAEEMAVIRKTKDRKKRESFLAIHRTHMREALALMRDMGGERMREVMTGHLGSGLDLETDSDDPLHVYKRMGSPPPRAEMSDALRLADLESRLDMMQVMLESLIERNGETNIGN